MFGKQRFWCAAIAGLIMLAQSSPALAYLYYPPGPQGMTGLSRPRIFQHFILTEGEMFGNITMILDGKPVQAQYTEDGMVYYDPPEDLTPGVHRAELTVEVTHIDGRRRYMPSHTMWEFTVTEHAFGEPNGPTAEAQQVLAYINELRLHAGVPPVTYNPILAQAARAHAEYMAQNDEYTHYQTPGKPLFTGEKPLNRARFFGYTGAGVSEDIHRMDDPIRAVNEWIAGPYHRFPILSPSTREIGFALVQGYAVLVMGLSSDHGSSETVVWPAEGATEARLIWDGRETPSPLRLYPEVNPPFGPAISLQFPPNHRVVKLTEARITRDDGANVPFMTFTPENDDRLDNALFLIPYKPLQPGTTYHVRIAGVVQNVNQEHQPFARQWSFTTEGSRPPVLEPEPVIPTTPVTPPEEQHPPVDSPTFPNEPPTTSQESDGDNEQPPTPRIRPIPPVEPTTLAVQVHLTDIEEHWARESIARLAAMGVVSGYPDGTFRPDETLTRSAFIKLLVSALNLPLHPGTSGGFMDTQGNWSASMGYIGAAVGAGLITPDDYPNKALRPEEPITRMEIARMLVRAAALPIPPSPVMPDGTVKINGIVFRDGDTWPEPGVVAAAIEAGLINGYPETPFLFSFRPHNPATRAEATTLVVRLLHYFDTHP